MTIDGNPSSNDDTAEKSSAPKDEADEADETDEAKDVNEPWWAGHPAITAARDEVEKWLAAAEQGPVSDDNVAAIHNDVMNGGCRRELSRARDDLDRARDRYAAAVKAARAVGYSWGEIGRVLGVPRQLLFRRFRNEVD